MIILQRIFLKILYSSLTATVMVSLVLLLKRIFKHRFSPRFHHILWLLVLIRLLIPFAPESNLSLFNLLPGASGNIASLEGVMVKSNESSDISTIPNNMARDTLNPNLIADSGEEKDDKEYFYQDKSVGFKGSTPNLERTNWSYRNLRLFSCIWFMGFCVMAVFVIIAALKFSKDVKTFEKVVCPEVLRLLSDCEDKLFINKSVELYSGKGFSSPFIFGILKPGIYIPKSILSRVNERELSHILLHELSHYKRRDLLCNFFSTVATMLHWFNPAVWFAIKRMRTDIECACDAHVLENLRDGDSIPYGMTIIKLTSLISEPHGNRALCAYFHESKGQIERRINMINKFTKGSYKLSAMAMTLLIALSCCTLTNAKADFDVAATLSSESMKEEQFNLEDPYKEFYNLDRAMDFIDFDFKVPDKIPTGYEFLRTTLDEVEEIVTVAFEKHDDTGHYNLPLLISKNDMIKFLKERHLGATSAVVEPDIKFSEEPKNILDIKGKSLAIYKNWEWSEEDLAELQKDDKLEKPEGGITSKRLAPSESVDKYFIWQDNGIWYSIRYYGKSTFLNSRHTWMDETSKDDIEILLSSLKFPQDIQDVEYISKDFNNYLQIYDNKDLIKAQEILGFAPKFPLDLPDGFLPTASRIFEYFTAVDDEDEPTKAVQMETVFHRKDKDIPQRLSFSQTKDTLEYDEIAYKGYMDDELSGNGEKLEPSSMVIDDIKVLTYERRITNPNWLDKGLTSVQYYIWKQDDIVYKAQFVGDIADQQKILKALLK